MLRALAIYLVIVASLAAQGIRVEAETTDISFRITSVSEKSSLSGGSADGGVRLQFSNHGTKTVCIIFSCNGGKGVMQDELTNRRLPGMYSPVDFAVLEYEWCDKYGLKQVSGTYEFGANSLNLEARGFASMTVPIKFPKQGGDYTLYVRFDNRQLEKLAKSYNTRSANSANIGFFVSTAQIPVKLNDSK